TVNNIGPDESGNITIDYDDLKNKPTNLETTSGAQSKADAAEQSAKNYTDQEVSEIKQQLNAHQAEFETLEQNFTAHQADVATYTGTCTYSNNVYTITFDSEIANDIFTVKFKAPN